MTVAAGDFDEWLDVFVRLRPVHAPSASVHFTMYCLTLSFFQESMDWRHRLRFENSVPGRLKFSEIYEF